MIPFVKSSTSSNKKIYVGKIVHDGGDFATVIDMLNAKLKGENVLNLTVKQTRDIGAKYSISIKEEGINITASMEGAYPAFSTLIKLVWEDENGTYFLESAIFDQARFSYRSAMLDDARYFHGKENVKKFLDVLFNLKFSVFHWHLSDDQGFRLRLDGIEDVCEKASKRKNSRVGGYVFGHADGKEHQGIYKKEDVAEIIHYAKDRGIKVIPEIDLP
ncbi:MAG: family 20 glycosylhydrolase, partial [Clostridia bacterium]|nr:family 20 glycosylhydrolase [Clostridia bacterium]